MIQLFQRIAHSHRFERLVLGAILLTSLTVGLETYPGVIEHTGPYLHMLDLAVIWLFVAEAVIKIGAHGRRPWRYFKDPWNVFDFAIVALAVTPIHSTFAAVLRLVRVLRVLRLVKALPRLRMIVNALIKSFSAMGYIALLLAIHFYIFATLGVSLFGQNDPVHFGRLENVFLTLFQVLTLDGWNEVMDIQMQGGADSLFSYVKEHLVAGSHAMPIAGALYFVVFVLLGTVIILNLFIGVITNGMSEAQREMDAPAGGYDGSHAHMAHAPMHQSPLDIAMHGLITTPPEPTRDMGPVDVQAMDDELAALQEELARLRQRLAISASIEHEPEVAGVAASHVG